MKKKRVGYRERKVILEEMGYASYVDYLSSDLWKSIRGIVLNKDGTCRVCKSCPVVLIHHNSYERDVLEGNRLEELYGLCYKCHRLIEFDADGNKILNAQVVFNKLLELVKQPKVEGVKKRKWVKNRGSRNKKRRKRRSMIARMVKNMIKKSKKIKR